MRQNGTMKFIAERSTNLRAQRGRNGWTFCWTHEPHFQSSFIIWCLTQSTTPSFFPFHLYWEASISGVGSKERRQMWELDVKEEKKFFFVCYTSWNSGITPSTQKLLLLVLVGGGTIWDERNQTWVSSMLVRKAVVSFPLLKIPFTSCF